MPHEPGDRPDVEPIDAGGYPVECALARPAQGGEPIEKVLAAAEQPPSAAPAGHDPGSAGGGV
jgi:hypothetical protein